MAVDRGRGLYEALLLLLTCLCACEASTPFVAWSNRNIFSQVSQENVVDIASLVTDLRDDLMKLNFIVVFSASRLSFDDFAKYGGLYGDSSDAPLTPLKTAVSGSESSVWGGTEQAAVLTDELALKTLTTLHYLTDLTAPYFLKTSGSLQLLLVELEDTGSPKTIFTQHGSRIAEVMSSMESLEANFAAFYTTTQPGEEQLRHMFRRSTPNLFGDEDDDANSTGLCNRVVGITRINETNNEILEYCAMMCIRKTQHLENETNSGNFTALKAVYWPSWKNMEEKSRNKSLDVFHCNISSFNFIEDTGDCSGSSLQQDYLSGYNGTSKSIHAILNGTCGTTETHDMKNISLRVEFIFISAKDKLVPLPRGQLLPPSDWTMQLMVTDITDGDDGEPMYMTRYRTGLKLGNENGSLTERRDLFYPFIIPRGTSYSCLSHINHLYRTHGNLNRFVATALDATFNTTNPVNITDGPVLQFVGLQVEAFSKIFVNIKNNNTFFYFGPIYDCEGFFDVGSWMGTVTVLIMALMLYLATLCLFSTQTMDRFDDARGQTISVENLH